jgi:cysteine-rich repeat protein
MYSSSNNSVPANLLRSRHLSQPGLGCLRWLLMVVALLVQPAFAVQMCNDNNRIPGDMQCGDGRCQLGEVCDDGSANSDNRPNACRTDCRYAYCGDRVKDHNEQCDDGYSYNANPVPNRCRPNCVLPRCGDGVTDDAAPYSEQCDDANNSNSDGCLNSCKACVMLGAVGNIEITDDTELCAGEVKLDDYGDYGTVIIKRSGVTLNCNGLQLTGEGRGVGIMIFRSNDVTIKNCGIYGFDTGIKGEDSDNITLLNNRLCNNKVADIDLPGATQMAGNANACKKPGNWNDSGKSGCARRIAVCNALAVQVSQPSIKSDAAQSLQHMPQVTVQPQKPSVGSVKGSKIAQRTQVKPAAAQPQKRSPGADEPRASTAAEQPDLAISRARFLPDCKVQLRLENLGGTLSEKVYLKGGVMLQRQYDKQRPRRIPLARIDTKKALLTGRGIGWTDSSRILARKVIIYQLVGLQHDANPKNNLVKVKVPQECQAK